ncbi:MAG: hypothetical protein WC438_06150 [Candidatus Pacearchaeota archaeon]
MITKEEFIELIGEDPEDVLGLDWEELADEYIQDVIGADKAKQEAYNN